VKLGNMTQDVPSVIVTAGAKTATSDGSGKWSLRLPTGEPFSLVYTADGYATLTAESATLSGDYDNGATPLMGRATAQLLTANIPSFDKTLGMVAINVVAAPSCASEEGATLTVTAGDKKTGGGGAGDPQLVYFVSGLPSPSATGVQKGATPAAIAYNLPIAEARVTIRHPSCTADVPPVTQGTITYHGTVQVAAAQPSSSLALSFLRAFVK